MADEKNALALRETISIFAFPTTPNSTPPRRSSRISTSIQVGIKEEALSPSLKPSPQKKRALSQENPDGESPKKKKKPPKRSYADPETYAHLNVLSDYLAPHLDVVFCGINPGCMSATKGHHFANPTNHFWRGLYLSGFTPRLLPASEDGTLPSLYNLGLTNLVERPSAEQAELSKEEMRLSVPSLKAKLIHSRPYIVCFVGKGMWQIVEAAFKEQLRAAELLNIDGLSMPQGIDKISEIVTPPSTPSKFSLKHKPNGKSKNGAPSFDWGLQPYKFVYPTHDAPIKEEIIVKEEQAISGLEQAVPSVAPRTAFPPRETLFFVMPSTSGRVVSHQLTDKVKLFTRLKSDLEALKTNTLDTSAMAAVPLV